jgi:hypothetical protein
LERIEELQIDLRLKKVCTGAHARLIVNRVRQETIADLNQHSGCIIRSVALEDFKTGLCQEWRTTKIYIDDGIAKIINKNQ